MSHSIFLTHRALPGRRDELVAAWTRRMPSAVAGNPGHEAYFYCTSETDPDVVRVYQQYVDAAAASEFLRHPEYLAYLEESRHLLACDPAVEPTSPRWVKSESTGGPDPR